ncbi:adenylyl-sulfate kinase [Clavibacter zhangzhiyongii]|uniref:adenylyl-sulfate kinase n=1 Tax=Clavibacter zhangzhiyongii TaxID=2768071 RepID=UPI0039DF8766
MDPGLPHAGALPRRALGRRQVDGGAGGVADPRGGGRRDHALIEGDALDQAHPEPWRQGIPLAERNLAALWRNYREAGWTRVIYTNTVSVLELPGLTAALGGEVDAVAVLLTADDATAASRLAGREIGSGLAEAIARSAAAAPRLEAEAADAVHRVATDGRTVADVAAEVVALSGWFPD